MKGGNDMCGYKATICDFCIHKYEYVSNPYFRRYCDAFPTDKGIPLKWWEKLAQFEHPEEVECANGVHYEGRKRK